MGWFRRNEHDEEALSAYLDGELDSRHAEKVESHLLACASCAALLEELRGTRALLSALPAQTPGRSFVLGAEYARAPVQGRGAPTKRFGFGMALAPAMALSVLLALVVVDLSGSSGSSDDGGAGTFTAMSSREEAAGSQGASSDAVAPPNTGDTDAVAPPADGFDASAGKTPTQETPVAAAADMPAVDAGGAAAGSEAAANEGPIAAPEEGELRTMAAEAAAPAQDAPPEPLTVEAPQPADDDSDGISTLRILQIVAAAAFLASGLYVFVWPRVSRGGS